VPRYAPNKMPTAVKKRYFELIRSGMKGAAAARVVGVSTSCGSLWFLDAGGVITNEPRPISARFLTQDDRIVIADGLRAGLSVKQIGGQIGKSFQTVYREVRGNCKPDGSYQPWWAHNQAVLRRRRPQPVKLAATTMRNRPCPHGQRWSRHPSRHLPDEFPRCSVVSDLVSVGVASDRTR
jgi:transposase, IS30 family